MANVPKSPYARMTVGKKNAALLALEYFRSRRRSRNISYVYIQIWSETYFDVFVVCAWIRLLPFFSLGKECFVVVVWRPVRIRVGVTVSHVTLRIPYLDGPHIGNPVELLPKSDFIRNEALPGNSCACCVRCWRSPGRAH